MTKALSARNYNDVFGFMPTFMSNWFDDSTLIPNYFAKSPKVNIKETDEAYEIEIANPGMTKNDVHVDIEDGILRVSIDIESNDDKSDEKYHVHEWSKSSYDESWYLPKDVIEDAVSAKTSDGVLTVTLPKKPVEDSKRISARSIAIE